MKVLLVTMPFARVDRPSLALGLLKAALGQDGVDCDVRYLNLAFAGRLGLRRYDRVAESRQKALAGDWVFAACLCDGDSPRSDRYVDEVLRAEWRLAEEDVSAVLAARALAPRFLDGLLSDVDWAGYDLVGFTCGFGQTVASLALARLVKQRHPRLLAVFGGPNWHDIMGRALFASFPFVDAACLGEGDAALPALVRALAEGDAEAARSIPGMLVRDAGGSVHDGGAEVLLDDLDRLPFPDYAEYAQALAGLGERPDGGVVVPVETSRGCWWSVREPCRFCGMVGAHRTYRAKSSGRILRELRALAAHPDCRLVDIVDNVVSPAMLATVLPQLAQDPLPAPLDMDIRPGVDRRTVGLLAETGTDVLAGIESFSERLLRCMHKGTSVLQNVRLLKWCRESGVRLRWNLLFGLPGETAEDYAELMATLRVIGHLEAPVACATIGVERFSSYFEDPETYGFTGLRPARAYGYVFPFDEDTLRDIAYFFDHEFARDCEPAPGSFQMLHLVFNWQLAPGARDLRWERDDGSVTDTRRPGDPRTYQLDDLERTLYLACDDIRSRAELEAEARRSGFEGAKLTERIDAALALFVERELMLRRDDRFLSLALCGPAPARPSPAAAASVPEPAPRRDA